MGKGGKSVETTIPSWLENAAIRNLNQADRVSRMGSVPLSYGPTVAAFTPMQTSSFTNTADMANAFGLSAPTGVDVTGGMAEPTTYANGVRAYSALPLYNQTMNEFRLDRPAQASYIDSFFINPYSGSAGSNMANVSNIGYTPPVNNMAPRAMVGSRRDDPGGGDQSIGFGDPYVPSPVMVGDKVYDGNRRATDYIAGEETPGHLDLIKGDLSNIGTSMMYGSKGFGRGDTSYDVGGVNNPFNNPTLNDILENEPAGYTYDPDTGKFNKVGFENTDTKPETSIRPMVRGTPSDQLSEPSQSSNECVIATHAVKSGAYNYKTLRQAEVWCMRKLHNRWWGETIRRGYRHLGRNKIAQGKAREHYDEFQRYIDFATGKKRTVRGALTFTLRSVQFFCVGIMKRSA